MRRLLAGLTGLLVGLSLCISSFSGDLPDRAANASKSAQEPSARIRWQGSQSLEPKPPQN
jgi:hypothetical protein